MGDGYNISESILQPAIRCAILYELLPGRFPAHIPTPWCVGLVPLLSGRRMGSVHWRDHMTWGKRGQTSLNVADRLPRYVRAVASAAPRIDIVRFIPVFIFLLTVISLVVSAMSFTILYTNDIHNRLGSLASLSALIERERVNDAPVLLFDSGDIWHDFRVPLYAVWGADEMIAWMNRVNYDAMAIGNHDLYYGADKLAELSSKADFPVLCSNMVPFVGEQAPYASYTIIDAAGMRVLVVGVITAEYLSYPDYPWLEYVDPAQAIQDILDEMRGKYDFVIVLG
ncbi:MAG TPA: bifunctional metallophosphatase/5'-nucleotidase, partial [Candidatus Acetothermia bacterium]|nr:bifunctional metallophosphatase/5'-nucleotidase [Candidatus Acetothermia bacterium]HEX32773.1 bifunctional metallophosphatase/5'-nucleotidase [Candidatus Acetothermia bacterium]